MAIPGIDPATIDSYLEQRRGRTDYPGGKPPPALSGYDAYLSTAGNGAILEIRAAARTRDGTIFLRKAIIRPTSLGGAPFKVAGWD